MRSDLPSGTVTFLFTDVEGSTKLLHSLGAEGYAEALAEHRRVIREACAAEGGVEVDTQGDAFFFAFSSAPGAIAAASVFTDGLASGPVQVRVGLHTGAPLLTEEGYVGDDVHFAARVASAAHGGQVILSSATAELVEDDLTDLGEHRLKDIEAAVLIYQLGGGSFPPLKTISNTNLPRPASSFVGREREVEEVRDLLRDGTRLLTLTGPGGSGKTRLAIEAAATLVPEYTAGVFWVGLASLRDPSLVGETIAQTLGSKNGLQEHIGERELLLLLDNLEQVVEAAPELAALVTSCPNLTLLVTSRERLRVSGEVEYEVPPLEAPDAVSLFCERSRLESSDEIAELCSRLDSLPLALELAAARCKALSPAQILARLSQRLDLLQGGRDADPRQQTLRATIEWSHELLTAQEQQLFARLSVFAGGCTLAAAEEICAADLDTLHSLVEKSLLRFGNERYWLLETIREYAAERLREGDEEEAIRDRHLAYVAALSERAYEERLASMAVWLPILDAERDNTRAALDWASTRDSRTETQLAGAVAYYWRRRGYIPEARDRLVQALARHRKRDRSRARALTQLADLGIWILSEPEALGYLEEALSISRELGDARGEALALEGIGHMSSDPRAAESAFEQSLAVLRDADGAELEEAGPLSGLCQLFVASGEVERVERAAAQLLELAARKRALEAHSGALHYLADCPLLAGDYPEAERRYARALAFARSAGFRIQTTNELLGVAMATSGQGDFPRAVSLAEAAYAEKEALGITRVRLDHFWGRWQSWFIGGARAQLTLDELQEAERAGREADFDAVLDEVLATETEPDA